MLCGNFVKGDWTCCACGHFNFKSKDVCYGMNCDMTQLQNFKTTRKRQDKVPPPQEYEETDWGCLKCGKENYASRPTCTASQCDQTQVMNWIEGGRGWTDWTCGVCYKVNFKTKQVCGGAGCGVRWTGNVTADHGRVERRGYGQMEGRAVEFKHTSEAWREDLRGKSVRGAARRAERPRFQGLRSRATRSGATWIVVREDECAMCTARRRFAPRRKRALQRIHIF